MAKSESSKEKASKFISRFSNTYVVLRSFFGLLFFSIAFGLFYSFAIKEGDIVKILVAFFGIVIILLCHLVILEYFIKTIALQNNEEIKRFTAILSVNTAIGLALPIWLMSLVLNSVMKLLDTMTYANTFWCEIRVGIVRYFFRNDVYFMLQNLAWALVVGAIAIFILGGIVERYFSRK